MDNKVIILAASLGGPPLVNEILSSLNSSFDLPLIVLQQMESDFSEPLTAAWGKTSALRLIRLTSEETLREGSVYVIPHCTYPIFGSYGRDVSIKSSALKQGTDVFSQWEKVVEECVRQFEGNVIMILLTNYSLQKQSLGNLLRRLHDSGATIIHCLEKPDLLERKQKETRENDGWLEMDIDQIIVYLQKISEGRISSVGNASGH